MEPSRVGPGVQIISADDSKRYRFPPPNLPRAVPPDSSFAASALLNLLDLDLGPEAKKLPGVGRVILDMENPHLFQPKVSEGTILIVVGPKREYLWSNIFSPEPPSETKMDSSQSNPQIIPSIRP
jgi:hypothetical protein